MTAAFDDDTASSAVSRAPRGWKRFVLILAIAAVAALAIGRCAIPGETLEDGEGLAGTYVLNGIDPLDTEYAGTVRITALGGDDYRVDWIIPDGFPTGIGRLEGDEFIVEWTIEEPVRSSGVAEYRLLDDGTLVGTRSIEGVDGVLTESIFPDP